MLCSVIECLGRQDPHYVQLGETLVSKLGVFGHDTDHLSKTVEKASGIRSKLVSI